MEADGVIHRSEEVFLDNAFKHIDVTRETLCFLERKDADECIQDFIDMSLEKRNYAKQLFVQMAECDGFVDPRELDIITKLCGTDENSSTTGRI